MRGPGLWRRHPVIQQDGADFIWRDVAWQTDEHADLERNGYHGTGLFRFAGAEYRAALDTLIDGTEPPVAKPRVLLIRARVAVQPAFERDGVDGAYVDGLVPIVPLLVAQIEHVLDRGPAAPPTSTG